MGLFSGNKGKDSVRDHKAAKKALREYGEHQVERHGWGKVYETPEDDRLQARVRETEKNVSFWRR